MCQKFAQGRNKLHTLGHKNVQIFFDLKKADRCKKWWICSKNPKIINFCVFLCFSVFFYDILWFAWRGWPCSLPSGVKCLSISGPRSHIICRSVPLGWPCRFRRLVADWPTCFFVCPASWIHSMIHSTHMESNVEQSNLCQHSHVFSFFKTVHTKPLCMVLIHWLVVFNVFLFSIVHVWLV